MNVMKKAMNIARAIAIFFVIGASGANLAHAEESVVRVMTYNACRGCTVQGQPLSQSAKLTDAKIVGEDKEHADIVVSPYPSDHRAVVGRFTLPSERKPE